jgi:competence protein ComEC
MWQASASLVSGACLVLLVPASLTAGALLLLSAVVLAIAAAMRRSWLAAFSVGVVLAVSQMQARLADRLAVGLENQSLRVTGTVVSVPQGTQKILKFRFAPRKVSGSTTSLPRLIELTWYDAPTRVTAAEDLELEVKLRRPRGFSNPGGQDNEARMLRDGVGASGYVRNGRRLGRRADVAWRFPVLIARAAVADVIRENLGERPAAGIVAGLAVGLQDAVSREQWLQLSRSGTSHLMAISGLHIAMVAAVVAWIGATVQRLRQRRGSVLARRDVAAVAGALAALVYGALAGASIPTQRTLIMIVLGALACCARRRPGIADGLGLCAAAVVVLDPLAPLAPGFWLSFGAVAAILFGATGYLLTPNWWRSYLQVQAIVTLGLLPVLIGSFGTVSLVAAAVNLFAIPLYTLVIVPMVLVSCSVVFAWPHLGSLLLDATARVIEFTWPLIEVPAGWAYATWPVAGLEPLAWAALAAGTLAIIAPLPLTGRLSGLALAGLACLWRPVPVPPGAARVTILDVGQGLSVVVETRSHVLVYDTGPSFRSGSDTGQLVIVPFLRHRGVRTVDRVVVTHNDDDHKGGAASLMALLPTRMLIAGPSIPRRSLSVPVDTKRQQCRLGDGWHWDGVAFEWMHPGAGPYARDNDSSCVLSIRAGDHRVLLTGDIEAAAESELVARADLGPGFDVVVVPHHGSRTSSSAAFVAATHPRWVVYAAGYRNRWRFPVPDVVERWARVGAEAVTTGTSGAVTFDLRPGEPVSPPRQFRHELPPPWRDK